ncbi:MAG TPA: DUF2269 family protein [Longimicrobiales bacterium]|nr:DUF2269 family protein [Longimicrobiales bacterium]
MVYTVLKFVHIASIAVWFGGLVTMFVLNRLFIRAGDSATMQGIGRQGAALSKRLFMPAMLVTLITGIGLVQVGDIGFGPFWIVWGIIGLIGSTVLGGVLTGAASRKLAARVARGEIDPAGIAAAQRRILMFVVLNMLLLLSVIWAMVAKPS